MKKILFFTAGSTPTSAEKTAFEALVAGMYTVEMRNGEVPASYGAGRTESTDFVSGTVPPAFSGVPVWSGGGDTSIAPTITTQAAIVGTPKVGVAISVTPPVVAGNPTPTVTKSVKVAGVEVSTGNYTPVAADAGKALTVVFTATNSKGNATSTAGPVTIVAADATVTTLYSIEQFDVNGNNTNTFNQVAVSELNRASIIIRSPASNTVQIALGYRDADNLNNPNPDFSSPILLDPGQEMFSDNDQFQYFARQNLATAVTGQFVEVEKVITL